MIGQRVPARVLATFLLLLIVGALFLLLLTSRIGNALHSPSRSEKTAGLFASPTKVLSTPPGTVPPAPTADGIGIILPVPAIKTRAGKPPFCVFSGVDEKLSEQGPKSEFVFGEPRVVASGPEGLQISQWLPDNETLLFTRSHLESSEQSIETLNLSSGKQEYWGNYASGYPLYWLNDIQAIAYVDMGLITDTTNSNLLWPEYSLDIIQESAVEKKQEIADFPLLDATLGPNGVVVLLSDANQSISEEERIRQSNLKAVSLPIDSKTVRYSDEFLTDSQSNSDYRFQVTLREDMSAFALYSYAHFYLYFLKNETFCEVDLGMTEVENSARTALEAKWSQNGRYLALITTSRDYSPIAPFLQLTTLDTITGRVDNYDLSGNVYEIEWSPNNRTVLALTRSHDEQHFEHPELALLDISDGTSTPVLPKLELGLGTGWNTQVAWSLDGRNLALKCPVLEPNRIDASEDRICIANVEVR